MIFYSANYLLFSWKPKNVRNVKKIIKNRAVGFKKVFRIELIKLNVFLLEFLF
jgi:hypothetical protein